MKLNINEWQLFFGMFGNRREKRRLQHLTHRADKKEAKRLRAERGKNVRPFVRRTLIGFIIRVGNDLEIYEPEAARLAAEEMEEINLFYDFYEDLEEDYDNWLSLHDNFRN